MKIRIKLQIMQKIERRNAERIEAHNRANRGFSRFRKDKGGKRGEKQGKRQK